jgi:hypothetical protein
VVLSTRRSFVGSLEILLAAQSRADSRAFVVERVSKFDRGDHSIRSDSLNAMVRSTLPLAQASLAKIEVRILSWGSQHERHSVTPKSN